MSSDLATTLCGPDWKAIATLGAALIGTGGIAYTLFSNRQKDRVELKRQQTSVQACIVADMRAVMRVIEVSGIVERFAVQCLTPDPRSAATMAPRSEDYFVLYAAIAADLGGLDREVARRASAFYQLLKGSRDIAQAFRVVDVDPPLLDPKGQGLFVRTTALSVLQMLEHVFRNGCLAVAIDRRLNDGPQAQAGADSHHDKLLGMWVSLVVLQDALGEDDPLSRPLGAAMAGAWGSRQQEVSRAIADSGVRLDMLSSPEASGFVGKALTEWAVRIEEVHEQHLRMVQRRPETAHHLRHRSPLVAGRRHR